jgi:hypothetical protein
MYICIYIVIFTNLLLLNSTGRFTPVRKLLDRPIYIYLEVYMYLYIHTVYIHIHIYMKITRIHIYMVTYTNLLLNLTERLTLVKTLLLRPHVDIYIYSDLCILKDYNAYYSFIRTHMYVSILLYICKYIYI